MNEEKRNLCVFGRGRLRQRRKQITLGLVALNLVVSHYDVNHVLGPTLGHVA